MTDRELLEMAATRQQALDLGEKRYFTDKPCRRGHVAPRYSCGGACVECQNLAGKALYKRDRVERLKRHAAYRASNRELLSQRFKAFYQANKERRAEGYRRYREKNRDKEAARHIRYRMGNLQACKEREKLYRISNRVKLRVKWARRRSVKAGAEGAHAVSDIARLAELQRGCCANCRCRLLRFHVDHITPLSRGGSNWPNNLQLLCPPCNLRKHAKTPERWANEQGRLL